MAAADVSRWSRRFVLVGSVFFVVWQVGGLFGVSRVAEVFLGLFGFVFHVLFGKAYALIPSYFDRELRWPRAPGVHFPLSSGGTVGLVSGAIGVGSGWLMLVGSVLWLGGVLVFIGTVGWTVSGNVLGRETGTSSVNADRAVVDRFANLFVPVALVYLLVSSVDTAMFAVLGLSVFGGYQPAVTHLFAVGTVVLFVFAIGFRLLPRFYVAHPPVNLVRSVLVSGAIGPFVLVFGFPTGGVFQVGAVLVGYSIVGYAGAILWLYWSSDRSRVGLVGVLVGASFGMVGVGFGLWLAFVGLDPAGVVSHYRIMLLGFLSITIMGVSFQFYPPNIGTGRFVSNRAAGVALGSIAGSAILHVVGSLGGVSEVVLGGFGLGVVGAVLYATILFRLFFERYDRI